MKKTKLFLIITVSIILHIGAVSAQNIGINEPNTDATNSSGFTALPGGFRYAAVLFGFDNLGGTANFWSCSEGNTSGDAWNYIPSYNWGGINIYDSQKALGYSVRCIKD